MSIIGIVDCGERIRYQIAAIITGVIVVVVVIVVVSRIMYLLRGSRKESIVAIAIPIQQIVASISILRGIIVAITIVIEEVRRVIFV